MSGLVIHVDHKGTQLRYFRNARDARAEFHRIVDERVYFDRLEYWTSSKGRVKKLDVMPS